MKTLTEVLFDDKFCLMAVVLFTLAGFLIGAGWRGGSRRDEERQRAIKAGVGQYVTNPKTGETTFVYGVVKP